MGGHHELGAYLDPVFEESHKILGEHELSSNIEWILMGTSVVLALIAMGYAYGKYVKNAHVPVSDTEQRPALANASYHKFYVDELYDAVIRKPLDKLSVFFYNVIEKLGIDGIVNGVAKTPVEASKGLRLLQTGNVGFYIFMMVVGIITILVYSFISIHNIK
jgi:NADH-quinone oxidoreductase subunit L